MNQTLPYKTKQFFFVLIKLSIVVGAFYFIYNKLTNNETLDFDVFVDILRKNDAFSLKTIAFLLFLSILNWFLEITKWQILVNTIKYISFKTALEQSLGALTASLFTPNRIGEYGAKAFYYKASNRKRIMLLNLIGNMMQMSITVILGVVGVWFLLSTYTIAINYYRISRFAIIALAIAIFIGVGIVRNNIRVKGFNIKKIWKFIIDVPSKVKGLALLISLARYMVFSFQFYFLLGIFGVDIRYPQAMILITSMYLLASIVPSIFLFDVVIKGSVALYLFSLLEINNMIILSSISMMWLLNFALPSVFGSFYILNFNLPKDKD